VEMPQNIAIVVQYFRKYSMRNVLRFFIATILILTHLGIDRASADSASLISDPFNEDLRSSANISGALIMGIQRQGIDPNGIAVAAYIPQDWAGTNICTRVVSIDGLYEATNAYAIAPDWEGGMLSLPYPTEFQDQLAEKPLDGVGVYISQGACSARTAHDTATLASWNAGPEDRLGVLINSFRADAVYMYVGNAPAPEICQQLPSGNRAAFDTLCPLNSGKGGKITLEIHRLVNRKPARPFQIDLWLPPDGGS